MRAPVQFLATLVAAGSLVLSWPASLRAQDCAAPFETPAYTRPPDDGVALASVLEASGYAPQSNSDWVDAAAGNFCGGPEKELVLVKNKHSNFSILRGPAPYPVGTGDLASSPSHPWRAVAAANLDGGDDDEIIAVRRVTASGVPNLVVAKADRVSCEVTRVIATTTIGIPAGADWVDIAVGRFSSGATRQIALLTTPQSTLFLVTFTAPGTLSVQTFSLESNASRPWKALAAGDLDGDGIDELIGARRITDGRSPTVLAFKRTEGSGFKPIALSRFGNTGNSIWASAAAGDFNADGRQAIVLLKDDHSNFAVLDLPPGALELRTLATADLDSAPAQPWRALVATDWLGSDLSASELVAIRAARDPYRTDVFVYGNPFHRASRDTGLARTKAEWDQLRDPPETQTAARLRQLVIDTHANTVNWQLGAPGDYVRLVEFLRETADTCVDGRHLRVWVSLYPPKVMGLHLCSLPMDTELTGWRELDYFKISRYGVFDDCRKKIVEDPGPGPPIVRTVACDYCRDFLGWASLLGRLAQDFPHLVAVGMDDFKDFMKEYPGESIAELESRLRAQASWLNFVPTLYYDDLFVSPGRARRPDVTQSFDSVLFFFRNNKRGDGPCTNCSDHDPGWHGCLDGVCAEPTVANAPDEFADVIRLLPAGRELQVGVYFARHQGMGEPSVRYDFDLVNLALTVPGVGGTTAYAMQDAQPCPGNDVLANKFCALRAAYGRTPAPPAIVPDVTELSIALAAKLIREAGLVPNFVGDAQGTWVVSQSPAAGTVVTPGSTVKCTKKRGPRN